MLPSGQKQWAAEIINLEFITLPEHLPIFPPEPIYLLKKS